MSSEPAATDFASDKKQQENEEEQNPLKTPDNADKSKKPPLPAAAAADVPLSSFDGPDANVPITEDDDDDLDDETPASPNTKRRRQHTSEIFAAQGGVKVSWRHISYDVTMNDEEKSTRRILTNLQGTAVPGRVLCIMGPSGAGKTTLLNTIGGRLVMADNSDLQGSVYLNDIALTEKHKPIVSFVCQDDIVMPKETPVDAFRFSASIRNQELPDDEVEERVENMIKDLKLTSCRDTVMGVPGLIKGLSGGEKRRCNIGVELINNPPVIYLDEPTSGLDSVAAHRIGKLLRSLAHMEGRTVICTVHSPSSELFALFDDLMLLAQGQVVYHGPVAGVKEYFASIGFPPPERINPAEFAMYLLQSAQDELDEYIKAWQNCAEHICPGYTKAADVYAKQRKEVEEGAKNNNNNNNNNDKEQHGGDDEELITRRTSSFKAQDPDFFSKWGDNIKRVIAPPPKDIKSENVVVDAMMKERKPADTFHQWKLVSARSWRNLVRDPMLTVARTMQTIVFALFIGLVYVNLKTSPAGVQDRFGLLFLYMIQITFLSLMPALMAFPPELAVFLQDMGNGLYSPNTYYWAKAIVELPVNTIIPSLFCIIIYFMAGLGGTAEQFFRFYLISLLTSFCARALGMVIGAFSGRTPEAAMVAAPTVIMPMAFVAGLFANTERLEPGWTWLMWISFPRYSYKAMSRIEFEGVGQICTPGTAGCTFPTGESVIRFLGFDQYEIDKFGYNVLMLCIIMMLFSVMGAVALVYQSWKQQAKLLFERNHKRMYEESSSGAKKVEEESAAAAAVVPAPVTSSS